MQHSTSLILWLAMVSTPTSVFAASPADLSLGVAKKAYSAEDFVLALSLYSELIEDDKKLVKAYIGKARAELGLGQASTGQNTVRTGLRYARLRADVVDLHTTNIRLATLLDFPRGLKKARASYRKATRIKQSVRYGDLHLAMAAAWLKAHRLDKAKPLVEIALDADPASRADAEATFAHVQIIERLMSAEGVDEDLVFEPQISRAGVADMLVNRLDLVNVLNIDVSQPTTGEASDQNLTDYRDDSKASEIVTVHRLGIRALRIKNGKFSPHANVTRVELALIIEDILHMKEGISRTQYIGNSSPFSDLSSNHTGFNAIMTAVTRGLMEGRENGQIEPDAAVSGAAALLVLSRLKRILGNILKPTEGHSP